MTRPIRIYPQPQDPVVLNRLVRLLIAQAVLEAKRQQVAAEVSTAKALLDAQEKAS